MNQTKKQALIMSLRDLRKQTKYSQQDVASLLNIKQRTLSDWENGLSTPPSELIRKIASLYDVSPTVVLMACESIKDQ